MKRTIFILTIAFFMGSINSVKGQTVDSLSEFQEAVKKSNQNIILKAGDYYLEDLPNRSRVIDCAGSNNTIDMTGARIYALVGSIRETYFTVSGDDNVFRNGAIEDYYKNGQSDNITNYSAYNNNPDLAYGLRGAAVMTIFGDDNLVQGLELIVRGSDPYGYGSIYGIGRDHTFSLDKRCGLLITGREGGGRRNTLDGVTMYQNAFGHGIFMQDKADGTVIKNCYVEGRMRLSADLYNDVKSYDYPFRSKYKIARDGTSFELPFESPVAIPMDVMYPLSEDGIRSYGGSGSVRVENSTVKQMRGGIRLYLASKATVVDSKAIDCGATNFNMPTNGTVTGSSGNFSFGPINDNRLSRSRQDLELTIIPSPNATGPHNIADITGNDHDIVFHRTPGPLDTDETRAIVVTGDNSTIVNETEYKIILERSANGNTIISCGEVIDRGSNNRVTISNDCADGPNQCVINPAYIEAECYTTQSGVQSEPCSEGGLNIGYINNGDWMLYRGVDLTNTGSIDARVASNFEGGTIEVRLGSTTGTLIGALPVSNTGGHQAWVTLSANIESVPGVQDVYLVFKGGNGYLFNINYFGFSPVTLSTDDNEKLSVTTFPNPVINTLNIQNGQALNVEVYNSLGQLQFENKVINNEYKVDMSTYSSGLYFLKMSNGKTTTFQKIIKK